MEQSLRDIQLKQFEGYRKMMLSIAIKNTMLTSSNYNTKTNKLGVIRHHRVQDAKDIVQNTFFRLFNSKELGEIENMEKFLATNVYRETLNFHDTSAVRKTYRTGLHHMDLTTLPEEFHPTSDINLEESLTVKEILKLINNYSGSRSKDLSKTCLLLKIEGYSNAEIAKKIGVTRRSVYTYISRIQNYLKKCLKK